MKRLSLTLATSWTFTFQVSFKDVRSSVLDVLTWESRMHVPLKCWTKKSLCLVCKYFFLSSISLMLAVVLYLLYTLFHDCFKSQQCCRKDCVPGTSYTLRQSRNVQTSPPRIPKRIQTLGPTQQRLWFEIEWNWNIGSSLEMLMRIFLWAANQLLMTISGKPA